jgi:hypothetical protein
MADYEDIEMIWKEGDAMSESERQWVDSYMCTTVY